MGFLKILLIRKDLNTEESRDLLLKSHIPFLLQTSYLLHNSMSQELFREPSNMETRNLKKKKIEKAKILKISDDKLYSINFSDGE